MMIAATPPIAIAETSELISQDMLPGPVRPGSPAGPPKIFGWSCRPTCLAWSSTIARLRGFMANSK